MYQYDGISLFKLQKIDLPHLWKLKQESWFGTHQVTINTLDEQEAWFDTLDTHPTNPRNLVLLAEGPRDPNFGIFKVFGIDYVNRVADVGWDVFDDCRGKGLGKKLVAAGTAFCFNILNLHRLNAEILATNVASLRCADHAGYVHEGTKRMAVHKSGYYVDSLVLGILVSDWNLGLQSKTLTV